MYLFPPSPQHTTPSSLYFMAGGNGSDFYDARIKDDERHHISGTSIIIENVDDDGDDTFAVGNEEWDLYYTIDSRYYI